MLITTNDPNHNIVAPGVLLKTSVAFYGFDARKGDFLQLSEYGFLARDLQCTDALLLRNV